MTFRVFAVVVLVVLVQAVHAADRDELEHVRFSKTGEVLVFETYGIQDGSGAPYSNFFFVDVGKNEYLRSPIREQARPELMETPKQPTLHTIRAAARARAQRVMKQMKITQGAAGELVIMHSYRDLGANPLQARFALNSYPENNAPGVVYNLKIETRKGKAKVCEDFGETPRLLTLTLEKQGKKTVLQRDRKIPKSRGCPLSYAIDRVYVHKSSIAVFLRYTRVPAFEGADHKFLVVTGRLD